MTGSPITGRRSAGGRLLNRAVWLLWLFCCATLLMTSGVAVAQDTTVEDEPAVAKTEKTFDEPLEITTPVYLEGSSTGEELEIVIHRWTGVLPPLDEDEERPEREPPEGEEAAEAEPQTFVISVGDHPDFIQNISWVDGPELVYEPGESSKTVTLVFDTAAEGESGLPEEEAELVLVIEARDDTVEPGRRELVVPLLFKRALEPGESAVTVCALREDAPEDFPDEEAYQYCDPERVPVLRYDRLYVFFTPARDLREPIGEAQYFAYRIVAPNGHGGGDKSGAGFYNKGSVEEPELTLPFAVEGSPGRFAISLRLWLSDDDPDPSEARYGPGIYTVQTAPIRIEGSAVFGQGDDVYTVVEGEWQDEGTFEIGSKEFQFKGFVAEQAGEVQFPADRRLRQGSVTYGEPRVDGTRVTVDLSAQWQWNDRDPERVSSRLVLELPEWFLPGFDSAGEVTASLEQLSGAGDAPFTLTSGLYEPVITTTRPPGRRLAQDGAPPLWFVAAASQRGRHEAGDASRCDTQWVWTQNETRLSDPGERTSGRCTFTYFGMWTGAGPFGEPERTFASHLHDPESLLVIPVFYAVRGRSLGADLATFGYAVYGVGPGPYDGPLPTEKPEGGVGQGAPPVLKLLEIIGENIPTEKHDYTAGEPGFSHRDESRSSEGSLIFSFVESVKLADLPTEIRLGEAFEVAVDARKAVTFADCGTSAGGVGGKLNVGFLFAEFRSKGKFAAPRCGDDDPRGWAREGYTGPVGGGSAELGLRLVPQDADESGGNEVKFSYRAEASGNEDITIRKSDSGIVYTWNRELRTTPEGFLLPGVEAPREAMLRVTADLGDGSRKVVALYGPVHSADEGLDPVPAYGHPPGAIAPPGGTPPGDDVLPPVIVDDPPGPDTPDADDELDPTRTPGDRDGFDPNDPNTWDPDKDPDVANHIRTWLATAEPPANAVPGSNFSYDEFGRTVGVGATIREVSRHDSVDYNTGASSEATVWVELRKLLDSIDHCILEEYVVARVQEGSIDHCRGRYGAVRDLGGVPLAEAKAEVVGGGFEWTLAPGSPAPSPELEGAVERQHPLPTQYLKRGQTLTLVVHSPYVADIITAPDLVGLSRTEAKKRLEDEGLTVALRPGSAALSPAESDTIERQEPAPGATIEPGAEVAIWVRPAFVATSTIPDLVGLSTNEARAALAAVGIDAGSIDLVPGSPAPNPAQAGKVESQEPAAGWTVEPGRRVTLEVHSGFVDLRTVPSLVGLSSGEAKRRLAALGLRVELAPGSSAPSSDATGTVQKQSPAGGSSVGADTVVTLSIHSPWVPPPTAVPPTAVPTAVTGTGQGELPLPDLQCPDFVTLSFNRDLCIYDPSLRPPAGARLPLDRQRSGHEEGSSRDWGMYIFRCYYRIDTFYKELISIWWLHSDAQRSQHLGPCDGRREGERFGGTYGFFSPTHYVEAKLNGNCFSAQEYEALARRLIRQTEPFAKPCAGAPPPPPTPVPPPPTVAQRRRMVRVYDLTGDYNNGRVKVTLENGRYIARNLSMYNHETNRRQGFFAGMVLFDVAAQPDLEESVKPAGDAHPWTKGTAYAGRCVDVINDRVAFVDCHVHVGYDVRTLKMVVYTWVMKDGRLRTRFGYEHNTHSPSDSFIREVPY